MASNVKIFAHDQTGAPTITGEVGSIKTLLDACLLSTGGYNTKSVSSISLSGTEATVTCTGHGYSLHSTIVLSGVTVVTGLNDDWQITEVTDTDTFKFATTLTGSPGGTISAKTAPAGWSADYTGTNKSTYRSQNGEREYLRVDDTNALYADIQVWEGATDVDTPTGKNTASRYWKKSNTAGAATRNWWLIVGRNETFFHFLTEWHSSYALRPSRYYFGEYTPFWDAETYSTVYNGHTASAPSWSGSVITFHYVTTSTSASYSNGAHFFVGADGSTVSTPQSRVSLGSETATFEMGRNSGRLYPNPLTSGFSVAPSWMFEVLSGDTTPKGYEPGIFIPVEQTGLNISDATYHTVGSKNLFYKNIGGSSSSYYCGCFFDITGPWI
jgi:hypothetical protein